MPIGSCSTPPLRNHLPTRSRFLIRPHLLIRRSAFPGREGLLLASGIGAWSGGVGVRVEKGERHESSNGCFSHRAAADGQA
jgi:hypothetical protein